ncbi:MAG: endolytic transglycosylase MltG, partial [Angelakisella sp.]
MPKAQRYKEKSKGHPFLIFLVILLLLLIAVAVFAASRLKGEVNGSSRHISSGVTVEIPKGASTADVADILKEKDIIGNALVFRAYSKYSAKSDGSFQYGTFTLVPIEGYDAVIKALQTTVQHKITVTVTFPEGYNAF